MIKQICVATVLLYVCGAGLAQGILFEHGDFASVCAKAKKENKLIFIDFYTSWCGPCKRMRETVFMQDNVGKYFNDNFVNYKIDAEKGEGKDIAAKYHIQYYPTYFFIDSKGAVFNKAIGFCPDTVFLGYAGKAQQEFVDPSSLPRLRAQYAAKKKDTAYLRLYINKLVAASLHAFDLVEQYLSIQTAMRADSHEMMEFICHCRAEVYYGGKAALLLEKYGQQYNAMADSLQRTKLAYAKLMISYNTRDYAIETKSETLLKRYIAGAEKLPPAQRPYLSKEGIWLQFYSATGNWVRYQPLANRWLDSISSGLKLIGPPADSREYLRAQSPEVIAMRRAALLVSDNAKIYRDHFPGEKEVVKKALRWVKASLTVINNNSSALTFYANLLYEDNDTANAISAKIKALNSLPQVSLHRDIVQTNLAHMQKGEPLDEE